MNRASSATGWVRNPDGSLGWTWNPITGCLNHVDGMCKGGNFPCYAYRLAHGRLRQRYLANKNVAPVCQIGEVEISNADTILSKLDRTVEDPFYPRFWPERLGQIPLFGKSLGIFVCDMGELFGDWIPRQWTERVLNHIGENQRHRFYLLTKQPQNLAKWSPFPENCWVGVTATDQEKLYWAVQELVQIEAKVKYLSLEPLLEWVSPTGWLIKQLSRYLTWGGINWLIIGAQTKPYRPPKLECVQEIVEAADRAGIPVFLKDNLKPLLYEHISGEDEWALSKTNLYRGELFRQEMPHE